MNHLFSPTSFEEAKGGCFAYVFNIYFLVICVTPIMSTFRRLIFTKMYRDDRTLAADEGSEVIISISKGHCHGNHLLLIVFTQFYSPRQITEMG